MRTQQQQPARAFGLQSTDHCTAHQAAVVGDIDAIVKVHRAYSWVDWMR